MKSSHFLTLIALALSACAPVTATLPPRATAAPPAVVTATLEPQAVITQASKLYAGPANTGFEVITTLVNGEAVTPLGLYGDFVKIQTLGNLQGYVLIKQIEPLPADLPKIQPADLPKQTLDILPLLPNGYLVQENGRYILDNTASSDWYGLDVGPWPVSAPFSITLQAEIQGEFGGILLYGSSSETGDELRPILIVLPNGRIQFQDGITYDTDEITFPAPADNLITLEFSETAATSFDIKNSAGKILKIVSLTDFARLRNSQGLFPYEQVFIGLQTSPGSKLVLSKLVIHDTPNGKYNPLAERQCSLVLGEMETVLEREQLNSAGLYYWPDTVMGVLRDGDTYTFLAANSKDIGLTTGTMNNPLAGLTTPKIALQQTKQYFDYTSGGPVYRDASGMLLMVYHAEIWQPGIPDGFVSSLGMAKSDDGGQTWQDLGLIIAPNLPDYLTHTIDLASGPMVVKDDYLYIYFRDALKADNGGLDINMAVARAKIADVISAAQAGNAATWAKYYRNAWEEPGLGGKSSPLEIGNPASSVFDVKYSDYLGRYVGVGTIDDDGNMNLYYTESQDGLFWSPRRMVDESAGEEVYPSLVGLGANPQVLGSEFYVYFVKTEEWFSEKRWEQASLVRIKISCATKDSE